MPSNPGGSSVEAHVADVAARARSIDISFNLTSREDRQGTPLIDGPADAGVELLMRMLAAELGPSGVRVVGIHTAAGAEPGTIVNVSCGLIPG